ncbi:hypothetical protein IMZ48_20580 [Candidatus Bathyarchaeota archaeon]|nr:hypothetical protein [Candidatus Bathyarchaeota archaeon]
MTEERHSSSASRSTISLERRLRRKWVMVLFLVMASRMSSWASPRAPRREQMEMVRRQTRDCWAVVVLWNGGLVDSRVSES